MNNMMEMMLGDICRLGAGNAFPKDKQGIASGEVPFIKVSDFELSGNEVSIHRANNYVSAFTADELRLKRYRKGSTVFAKIGIALTYNRRRKLCSDTAVDNNLMVAEAIPGIVSDDYLYYLLRTIDFNLIANGSAIPYLNAGDIKKIPVCIHNIVEQESITRILKCLDDKIELNRETNETLEGIAKALFKSWFVDFDPVRAKAEGRTTGLPDEISELFPDSFEESELGEIPSGWKVQPLGEAVSIQYGKNLPTKNLISNGFPVFGGNGVIGFHSEYLYEDVMTLVSCRGAASGAVLRTLPKSFVTNNSLVIDHRDTHAPSQRYVEFFLRETDTSVFVTGSAQPQVTIDSIRHLPIVIPQGHLLGCFRDLLVPTEDKTLLIGGQNQCLSELRDALLPRLISGELRVPDAEKMLEEVAI